MANPNAPDATEQDETPGGDSQGYEIIIQVAADGTLSVGVEQGDGSDSDAAAAASPAGQAQAGQGDADQGDDQSPGPNFQPADSIKDALTMVLEIYRSNGGAPTNTGALQGSFHAGFGQ